MEDSPPRSKRELELEIQVLRLQQRVRDLEDVVKQQSEGLKESSKLLLKCKPFARPPIPHDKKLIQAAEQGWRCANPTGDCPQQLLFDGFFNAAGGLFEADHCESWSTSLRTSGNIQCLCSCCHNAKSRRDRIIALEQAAESADVKEES